MDDDDRHQALEAMRRLADAIEAGELDATDTQLVTLRVLADTLDTTSEHKPTV